MTDRKVEVLVVDDEQMVCDVLSKALNKRGYACTTVLSGHDALVTLTTQEFEVVLLDIRLPGMSGMEILREIRSNWSDTIIVMITGVKDVDTAVSAMKLGASDYIVKPFDLEWVTTSIRTALESKQATSKSFAEMDAIARGVEANIDFFSTASEVIAVQRTVDIAWQLGIAEEKIERWAVSKARLCFETNQIIQGYRRSQVDFPVHVQ